MKAMSEIIEDHRIFDGMALQPNGEDELYFIACDGRNCGWEASQEDIGAGNGWSKGGNHVADVLKAEGYGRVPMGYPPFEGIIEDAWGKVDEQRDLNRVLLMKNAKLAADNAELRQRVADLSTT